MKQSALMSALLVGALSASLHGCEPCGVPSGSVGTMHYDGDECPATGVVVTLDVGGEAYDYVEVFTWPLEFGDVESERIYPGPAGGTVSIALDPALDGEEVTVVARGYRDLTLYSSGSLRFLVSAGSIAAGPIDLGGCATSGSICTDADTARICEGDTVRFVLCVSGCDDGRCRPLPYRGACGETCGNSPSPYRWGGSSTPTC